MGSFVDLTAEDGHKLAAYRAEPSERPRGGVVVLQEIFGVNSHIRDVADGFAAHNMVYGMGGGLLQKVDRDMDRFAIKSSAQERDGQWVKVQKTPLDRSKASLAGRLQVVNVDSHDEIVPEEAWADAEDPRVRLKPVFENGVILRQHTFEQVRARARAPRDSDRWNQPRPFRDTSVV